MGWCIWDLLSEASLGPQADAIIDTFQHLCESINTQQPLTDAQGLYKLRGLLGHSEACVRLGACLLLISLEVAPEMHQGCVVESLAAALAGMLPVSEHTGGHSSSKSSCSSGSRKSRKGSNSHAMSTTEVPAAPVTWQAIPHLAAAAFFNTASPAELEELTDECPPLAATLAQLAVDQVEGALHGHVEQQQQQQQQAVQPQAPGLLQQQQPWQLPAAAAAMAGLLQLLCCDNQQVHCVVVQQLARLAYCTTVLDQLAVGLVAHPGAVAAVMPLLQPWDQTSFDEAVTAAMTSSEISNAQWPGGAAQLQAEAAAALLVLASLGKSSREAVMCDAYTVEGLLMAMSDEALQWKWRWQKKEEEEEQQQQQRKTGRLQVCSWFSLPCTYILQLVSWVINLVMCFIVGCSFPVVFCFKVPQICCWAHVWCVWCEKWREYGREVRGQLAPGGCLWVGTLVWAVPGACYELLVWVVCAPIVFTAEFCIIRVLCALRRALLPTGPQQPWVQLRQQWAAYSLWHLLSRDRANRGVMLQHWELADEVLQPLSRPDSAVGACTRLFVWDLALQAALAREEYKQPAARLRCVEPPPSTHMPSTWQWRLDQWALAAARRACTNLKYVLLVAGLAASCMLVGAVFVPWMPFSYMLDWQHMAWAPYLAGSCLLCMAAGGVCLTGMLLLAAAAVALVLMASRTGSYQLVVASRPAPAATQPRTWLQPVSYLALDFSYASGPKGVSGSVKRYSQFGEWPAVARFQPKPCAAQHVYEPGKEWLSTLRLIAWLYGVLGISAYVLVLRQDVVRACHLMLQASTGGEALQGPCGVLAASLQGLGHVFNAYAVLLTIACVLVDPCWAGWALIRCVLASCRWPTATISSAASSLVRGLVLLVDCGCGRTGLAVTAVLSGAWWCTKACVWAARQGVVLVAVGVVGLVMWLLRLPLRLACGMWSAVCAAGALVCKAGSGAVAAPVRTKSNTLPLHPSAEGSKAAEPYVTALAAPPKGRQGGMETQMDVDPQLDQQAPEAAAAAASGTVSSRSKGRRGKENRVKPQPSQQSKGRDAANPASVAATSQGQHSAGDSPAALGHAGAEPAAASSASATTRMPLGTASSSRDGGGSNGHMTGAQHVVSVSATADDMPPSSTSVDIQTVARKGVVASSSSSSSSSNPAEGTNTWQQREDARAAAESAAHGAARAAAAAAVAAGLPADEVLQAAARAAAAALEALQDGGLPFMEGSMLVVRAAAEAAAAVGGGHSGSAASGAMSTVPQGAGTTLPLASGPCPTGPAPGVAPASKRSKAARLRRECVVCLDARPSVTTHPCGHRVLCGGCAQLVAAGKGECPMCRAPVVRYDACSGKL
jgi:hypothetical protein